MYRKTIVIKKSTDDLIMKDCKNEYLRHHPELKHLEHTLSRDIMITLIADHYMRSP